MRTRALVLGLCLGTSCALAASNSPSIMLGQINSKIVPNANGGITAGVLSPVLTGMVGLVPASPTPNGVMVYDAQGNPIATTTLPSGLGIPSPNITGANITFGANPIFPSCAVNTIVQGNGASPLICSTSLPSGLVFVGAKLTSPTLTSAVIKGGLSLNGFVSGVTTLSPQPTGTGSLTLPAGSDTLVGLISVDILQNKTMIAPALGVPISVDLTNAINLPVSALPAIAALTNALSLNKNFGGY